MIEDYCKACLAVGQQAYRVLCDACGKEIGPGDSVNVHCGRRQLHMHKECAAEEGVSVSCGICGESASGAEIVHDAEKHLEHARRRKAP